jgi:hypothetical protein
LGSVAGPSELLHELAHVLFIEGQEICGSCTYLEGIFSMPHEGSLPQS